MSDRTAHICQESLEGQEAMSILDPRELYLHRKECGVLTDDGQSVRTSSMPCQQCSMRHSNCVFMPCRHMPVCSRCQIYFKKCPTCQNVIKAFDIVSSDESDSGSSRGGN